MEIASDHGWAVAIDGWSKIRSERLQLIFWIAASAAAIVSSLYAADAWDTM